jgi:hypothetical protein
MFIRATMIVVAVALTGCGSSPSGPGTSGQGTGLLTPADGSTVTGPDVSFTWDAISGATKYYHQVSLDASMQNPVETVVTGPSTTITFGSPGTWWWRVRASVTGQSTYTPWSDVWSFTIN